MKTAPVTTLIIEDLGGTDQRELTAAEMLGITGGVGTLAKIGIRLAVNAFIEAYENPISVDELLKRGKDQLSK